MIDRAEKIMRDHLGLAPPWGEPWKRRAFEYVLERVPEIEVWRDQGLALVKDEIRRKLILEALGNQNGHEHTDYNFNVWLANECIGEHPAATSSIFFRCMSCFKIIPGGMLDRYCYCGGHRLYPVAGGITTRKAMRALLRARAHRKEIERANS